MADPDLQMEGGGGGEGGGHPDPEIRAGPVFKKQIFQPFGSQFGPKIRGAQAPWAPPLDPPLRIAFLWAKKKFDNTYLFFLYLLNKTNFKEFPKKLNIGPNVSPLMLSAVSSFSMIFLEP